ncbi:Nif3-like dinuclear metal center hexameric protein, partial [Campylobacter jejuni]
MKLSEIYNFLDQLSPFDIQESWDNSGILLGDRDSEISTVYLSLDIDENIIKDCPFNKSAVPEHNNYL